MLSVDAFHASAMVVVVTPVTRKFPGAVGGCVSGAAVVVAVTALLGGDTLPAASKATAV